MRELVRSKEKQSWSQREILEWTIKKVKEF